MSRKDFAESDKVATRWTATGTREGELMGISLTDVQATVTNITIEHTADGKNIEAQPKWDALGMMQ